MYYNRRYKWSSKNGSSVIGYDLWCDTLNINYHDYVSKFEGNLFSESI